MSETTRVTEKGQATIPKELREKYGIESGDEVVWEETDAGIVLRKKQESARGAPVPDDATPETREAVAEELERQVEEIRDRNRPGPDTRRPSTPPTRSRCWGTSSPTGRSMLTPRRPRDSGAPGSSE